MKIVAKKTEASIFRTLIVGFSFLWKQATGIERSLPCAFDMTEHGRNFIETRNLTGSLKALLLSMPFVRA